MLQISINFWIFFSADFTFLDLNFDLPVRFLFGGGGTGSLKLPASKASSVNRLSDGWDSFK